MGATDESKTSVSQLRADLNEATADIERLSSQQSIQVELILSELHKQLESQVFTSFSRLLLEIAQIGRKLIRDITSGYGSNYRSSSGDGISALWFDMLDGKLIPLVHRVRDVLKSLESQLEKDEKVLMGEELKIHEYGTHRIAKLGLRLKKTRSQIDEDMKSTTERIGEVKREKMAAEKTRTERMDEFKRTDRELDEKIEEQGTCLKVCGGFLGSSLAGLGIAMVCPPIGLGLGLVSSLGGIGGGVVGLVVTLQADDLREQCKVILERIKVLGDQLQTLLSSKHRLEGEMLLLGFLEFESKGIEERVQRLTSSTKSHTHAIVDAKNGISNALNKISNVGARLSPFQYAETSTDIADALGIVMKHLAGEGLRICGGSGEAPTDIETREAEWALSISNRMSEIRENAKILKDYDL